jgi:HPt (histidine-containing phosphotransfer) domain-containing protein
MTMPIDLEYLQQLSDSDTEFELELLQIYLEDTKEHLQAAKAAIMAQDGQQLAREAHHLKGASGNVGAMAMQAMAYKLEQLERSHSWSDGIALVEDLEKGLRVIAVFVSERYA